MMGWLSSSGSVARIAGPLVASYALEYDPTGKGSGRLVFILMISLTAFCSLCCIVSYKILRPREPKTSINDGAP